MNYTHTPQDKDAEMLSPATTFSFHQPVARPMTRATDAPRYGVQHQKLMDIDVTQEPAVDYYSDDEPEGLSPPSASNTTNYPAPPPPRRRPRNGKRGLPRQFVKASMPQQKLPSCREVVPALPPLPKGPATEAFQSITAQPGMTAFSFEELRLEAYGVLQRNPGAPALLLIPADTALSPQAFQKPATFVVGNSQDVDMN